MALINLLPWRERARYESKIRFFITLTIVIGIALFISVLYHFYFTSLISRQINNNNLLRAELDQEKASLTSLMNKKKSQAVITENINYLFSLYESNYNVVRLLNELARIVSESILITEIKREKDTITLLGKTESNLQVSLFMENIAKSAFFQNPILTEISGKDDKTVGDVRNFKLKFQLKNTIGGLNG